MKEKYFEQKIYKEKISLNFNKWDLQDELCSYAFSCIYKIISLWIFFCLTGSSSIRISFPLYFTYLDAAFGVPLNCSGCSDGVISHAIIPLTAMFQNLSLETSGYSPLGNLNVLLIWLFFFFLWGPWIDFGRYHLH